MRVKMDSAELTRDTDETMSLIWARGKARMAHRSVVLVVIVRSVLG